jgi:hypothetical protein
VLSYDIDSDGTILTLTASGSPTPEEREAVFHAIRVDPRVHDGALLILDVRSVRLDLTEAVLMDRLRALIDQLGMKLGSACAMINREHGHDSQVVQIAGRDFGLRVRLFHEEASARQWLSAYR